MRDDDQIKLELLCENILDELPTTQTIFLEGNKEHPETGTTCLTPQALADELNAELTRITTASKDRSKRGITDVIYHKDQIRSVMDEEGGLNVEKFKALITAAPKTIFDQNPKMERSDKGRTQLTVNTGLPAISGIVYDETDGEFKHINTCPGAGACQLVCYARKGFYGMNDGKIMKLIRRLNLLWNNPEEYYQMIMDELEPIAVKLKRQGRRSGQVDQLVIRWNDAGDFFSETYYGIAKRVTDTLIKGGYDVKSYAYTKQSKFVNLASDDFIMNFSKGSKGKELKQVDLEKVKFSDIVPKSLFKQVFQWKGAHVVKDENGLAAFADGGADLLKRIISKEYGTSLDRLKYQFELPNDEDEKFKYDVIVLPTGDSDIGAQRNDVHKTFLLVH